MPGRCCGCREFCCAARRADLNHFKERPEHGSIPGAGRASAGAAHYHAAPTCPKALHPPDRRWLLLRRMAWLCTVLMLATISLSAFMRLSQAGLGCADWPACYAQNLRAVQQGEPAPTGHGGGGGPAGAPRRRVADAGPRHHDDPDDTGHEAGAEARWRAVAGAAAAGPGSGAAGHRDAGRAAAGGGHGQPARRLRDAGVVLAPGGQRTAAVRCGACAPRRLGGGRAGPAERPARRRRIGQCVLCGVVVQRADRVHAGRPRRRAGTGAC